MRRIQRALTFVVTVSAVFAGALWLLYDAAVAAISFGVLAVFLTCAILVGLQPRDSRRWRWGGMAIDLLPVITGGCSQRASLGPDFDRSASRFSSNRGSR